LWFSSCGFEQEVTEETPALTLTLSPGEREERVERSEFSDVFFAIAVSGQFGGNVDEKLAASAPLKRGERFSLSWGRGPG
jgi:hypothetical protein